MNEHLFMMALVVGIATYGFRVLPAKLMRSDLPETGLLARLLAATGPAAIATLFTASVLPVLRSDALPLPLIAGTLAVIGVYFWRQSVVQATLAGALCHGAVFALA